MKLIVAVDNNWAIGYNGGMLFRLPKDLKHFQSSTLNHAVVMGRSTLISLPGSKPLKNRDNIVLSRDKNLEIPGAEICNSIEDFLQLAKEIEKQGKEVFVIGGETVYSQLKDYCTHAVVTHIDAQADMVDTFFPDLSRLSSWKKVSEDAPVIDNDIKTTYTYYENTNVAKF